jgi:type IV pilus assembly protein PilY1
VSWSANTWYDLDDLSPVIQEMVNRPGWQSGNTLALIVKGTGAAYGRKLISSYDGDPAHAPRLVITYSGP